MGIKRINEDLSFREDDQNNKQRDDNKSEKKIIGVIRKDTSQKSLIADQEDLKPFNEPA